MPTSPQPFLRSTPRRTGASVLSGVADRSLRRAEPGKAERMLGEDILYLSLRELGKRIKSRTLSPVELTESYLARSERLGGRLNAYATLTQELALKQARAAEREIAAGRYRGPLHGIPYAAKDLLAVKGYPTTWGARPLARQKFDYDATVIERLDRAGGVLIGKAAMIELAGGMGYRFASASLTGPAKNPWKESCWTCGSSSGSGAIVAAALAAFAIGTETWGSIVCPSAYCGVTGLRPTYGRVSRYGAMALSYSMDKIGPMARTADDCALVLSAIAAHDPRDRGSLPPGEADFAYTNAPQSGSRPLRIGWLTNAWKNPDKGIAAVAEAALQVLKRAGAQVSEARLPEGRVAELDDPLGKIAGYVNEQLSASDYLRAVRVRGVLQKKMDALFEGFDVLAAASLPIVATPLETNPETDLNFPDPLGGIGNLCGLPVISVPCGFSEAKLPVGLQFAGRVRNDRAVIAAAHLFQQLTDWHTRRPPIS